jgi:hypothetical protein
MFRLLKKYFIPHGDNDHHPHILRSRAFVYLLGIAATIEVVFLVSTFVVLPRSGFLALIASDELVRSTNAARHENQKSTLATSALLQRAAQLKASDMATNGYFAHTSPAGFTPWHWLNVVGYKYASAAENLAVNFIEPGDVHRAWMNSLGHRQNILNSAYTEIGIASARGMYHGHETIFVVEFFAKPLVSALAPDGIQPKSVALAPSAVASIAAQIATTPRATANMLLMGISLLIAFAFVLTVFVRARVVYPRVALLPMTLLALLIVLVVVNQNIGISSVRIL